MRLFKVQMATLRRTYIGRGLRRILSIPLKQVNNLQVLTGSVKVTIDKQGRASFLVFFGVYTSIEACLVVPVSMATTDHVIKLRAGSQLAMDPRVEMSGLSFL